MPAIKLTGFTGEQPRVIPRLMPETAAQSAVDARLDDGSLAPLRLPRIIASVAESEPTNFQTIYRFDEDWLAFEGVCHFARGPVASERLYYTGDGAPKMMVEGETYDLAVPRPEAALTGTPSSSGSGDAVTRVYVFTYVTEYGEESEPSPASAEVTWQPGQTVILSGFEAVPTDRAIDTQRIYRSQTGVGGTDLYFIAERAAGTGDFEDDVAVDAYVEALPSRQWNAPPDGLSGLTALPNGMMAAFVGKSLYFCEPYRPHAWPEAYILTTDWPIVGLAAMDVSVAVLTTGQPYLVTGTAPESMSMEKVDTNLPCINARGIVDLGFASAWPTHDGLAVIRAGGGAGIVTGNIFSPRDWRKLNPATIRAGQINGRWIGSYDTIDGDGNAVSGSLLIDIAADAAFLIRSKVTARSWFYEIETGDLFFLDTDGTTIKQFDPINGEPATLYWRSKVFVLPKDDNFGCILIEAGEGASEEELAARQEAIDAIIAANATLIAEGSVGGDVGATTVGATTVGGDLLTTVPPSTGSGATVGVYADGVLVAAIERTDRVERLPAGFLARKWEIDVFGDIAIDQITMARTVAELRQVT